MNPVKKIWRLACALLFVVAARTFCFPLDSTPTIGQFTHTAWKQKEGAPHQIWAITQTQDGYLWLASTEGVFRFDGTTFEHYEPPSGPTLPSGTAQCLLALPNGDLWIGFTGAISLLHSGSVKNYASRDGVPGGRVRSLVQDREGTIWAGTDTGLARFEGGLWKEIGKEWNFFGKSVAALLVDRNGTLWAAPEDDSIVFLIRGTRAFQTTSVHVGEVPQIVEAPNGKLWMAEVTRSVRPIPLGMKFPPSDTVEIRVGSRRVLFAREGDLWISTLGDGMRRVPVPEHLSGKPGRFSSAVERLTTKDGLTDNYVTCVFQDRAGNIWAGTQTGLDRFRTGEFVPVTLPAWVTNETMEPGQDGDMWAFVAERFFRIRKSGVEEINNPGSNAMNTPYREPSGIIWLISEEPALVRFENGRSSRFSMPPGLPVPFQSEVKITEDGSGVLWMAIQQLGFFRREKGTWSRFETPPALSKLIPLAAFTDGLGRAWFGYLGGTIVYLEGNKIHTVSTQENSPVGSVAVIQGRNKHVWVGGNLGLVFFDGAQFHKVVPVDRPGFDLIAGIEELADGSLWLFERHKIIRIAAAEVRKFLETPSYRVYYQAFDSLGSVAAILKHVGPRLVEGTDGRIWVAGDNGPAWLDPATIPASVPPPLSIRSVTAGGKQFALQPDLTFAPRSKDLHVEYTALNLSTPEQVRYRYRLDGVDKEWQDAGVRREAFYTNLVPGKYRFHVTARNEGGEWNAEEAVLDFRIAPAWFQTIWFRALCIGVFLFMLWMLYQLRLRQLERQFKMTLEARVAERTRIARDLHDTLLQSFSASLLRFQSVSRMLPARPEDAKQRADSAIEQASSAIAEGRDAVHELRAGGLATTDLAQSISRFVSEFMSSSPTENPLEFRVEVEGTSRDLNPIARDEVYRMAVEALRNAIRHAGAKQIEVDVRYDERQLRVRVRDDGRGIDPGVLEQGYAPGHWGLRGMRERAKLLGGNFEVWSEVGLGTEVELTVPAVSAYAKSASRWSILWRRWLN